MDLSQYNVWMLLATNGFFTGFGGFMASLIGNFVWHEWIKPWLKKFHNKIKRKKKRI